MDLLRHLAHRRTLDAPVLSEPKAPPALRPAGHAHRCGSPDSDASVRRTLRGGDALELLYGGHLPAAGRAGGNAADGAAADIRQADTPNAGYPTRNTLRQIILMHRPAAPSVPFAAEDPHHGSVHPEQVHPPAAPRFHPESGRSPGSMQNGQSDR